MMLEAPCRKKQIVQVELSRIAQESELTIKFQRSHTIPNLCVKKGHTIPNPCVKMGTHPSLQVAQYQQLRDITVLRDAPQVSFVCQTINKKSKNPNPCVKMGTHPSLQEAQSC
jgi:hypothetical protein